MIHLIKVESQVATLYNTETKEVKRLTLTSLNTVINRGLILDNKPQATQILSGRNYRYFIKEIINSTKFLIANTNNIEETQEVARIGVNEEDYANLETYTMCLTRHNSASTVEQVDGLNKLIKYGCLAGTTYEEAKEQFDSPNEDLIQFMQVNSLWGSTDVSWKVDEDRANVYWAKPLSNDNWGEQDEVYVVDGITHMRYDTLEDIQCKKVILPKSLLHLPETLGIKHEIGTLDMSETGITDVSLVTDNSDTFAFKEIILPSHCHTIQDLRYNGTSLRNPVELRETYKGSDFYQKLIADVVYIPKSVKRILRNAVVAFTVVIERGIELELIDLQAIQARHIVMSDDPDLQEYISHNRAKQKNTVILDLGTKMRHYSISSLRSITYNSYEGQYSDTLLVEHVDEWPADLLPKGYRERISFSIKDGYLTM